MRFPLFIIYFFGLINICVATDSIPMPQHPRLLINAKEIKFLKKKLSHPDFDSIRINFYKQKKFVTNGISSNGEPDEAIRQKIEVLAFSYLIDSVNEKQSGLEAIRLINIYLPSISIAKEYHANAHAYQAVFTAALIYDWCYRLLNTDTKLLLIANMKRVSCIAEYCIFKNTPKQYLSGHYGEYAPTAFLAMGIAIYDEEKDVFDFAYQEQLNNFAPSRNPWYKSGTHHQGSQYIHVRYGHELLQAFLLEKIGLNPYIKEIAQVAYREMYATIPQKIDMDGMPEGDCHNNITMGNNYMEFIPIAATLSNDPFLQSYAKLNLNKLAQLSTRAFLFYNPKKLRSDFDQLKLTRFFSSPSGLMIARTKWDLDKKDFNSSAMVVLMNMREYSAKNHVHLDAGHFSIYYKGHLALDAGIYQGKDANNGWGKTNYVNYYARTVAHNSLLILDPNEPTPYEGSNVKAISRDGGQFSFKNRAWDSTQEMLKGGKSAVIMASSIADGVAPDYSYLKGDMTRCYNVPLNVATYPAKADTVRRSFVFLNLHSNVVSGALIVLDKVVSTNPSFKKSWLLHSQNEPLIANNKISFTTTSNGRNGGLINQVLLPEANNLTTEIVGGDGKEYWVDGKNWGTVIQEDAGRYRVEVSPIKPSLSDNFLNVIQVTDADKIANLFAVKKAYATKGNYLAVEIKDRIVAQQLALSNTDKQINFSIGNKQKKYKVLICDLQKGKWEIKVNNVWHKNVYVEDNVGTTYFTAKGGSFSIRLIQK
jgi:hypothetical protein